MNEATDLRHVICGRLTMNEWLKDKKRTDSFALWYGGDIKPTIYRYIYYMKEMLRRTRSKKDENHKGSI